MASMNKPSGGDTNWYQSLTDNWKSIEDRLVDNSTFTTKGDMIAATGNAALSRVAVGANNTVLTADDTQTAGVAWATAPGTDVSCRVYRTTQFAPASSWGNYTSVPFDNEEYDTNSMHDNTTNSERITIPSSGKYFIGGAISMEVSSDSPYPFNRFSYRILLNSTYVLAEQVIPQLDSPANAEATLTCIASLAATDYIELQVLNTVTDVVIDASGRTPAFWVQKMG